MIKSKKTRILVVEDEPDLNGAYKQILETAGYEVSNAYNGVEALEIVENEPPFDIILLDLRMPLLDGIGFLKKFDAPHHPQTSVVLFSNYDAQKEVDQAYSLGADHYILKAMASPRELLHSIEVILKNKG